VVVRALRTRNTEMYSILSRMNTSMGQICAGYTDSELELITGFLRRTAGAGRAAAEELTED
jgi:hypothetical protein